MDVATGKSTKVAGYGAGACSPDGKTWALLGHLDNDLWLTDAATGKTRKVADAVKATRFPGVAWAPDGKRLALSGHRVGTTVRDMPAATVAKHLPGADPVLGWSPDGKFLATGAGVFDVEKGAKVPLPGVADAFGWSRDGKRLYASGEGGLVLIDWASPKRKQLRNAPTYFLRPGRWPQAVGGAGVNFQLPGGADAVGRVEADSHDSVVLPLRNARMLVVAANGHYRVIGDEKDGELVYVVRTDEGDEVLTPAQMEKRYGWKNDPSKVRLLAD